MYKQLILLFVSLFISISLIAQEKVTEKYVKITTKDGTHIQGTVIEENEETMVIQSSFGESIIYRSNIEEIEFVSELDNTENLYSGSHYLFNQSAFNLKKGESYYENTYLFLNSFSFGITDNFSITAGLEAASIVFGPAVPGLFVNPKFSIPFKRGVFGITTPFIFGTSEGAAFGGLQGVLTLGTPSRNISFGGGAGINLKRSEDSTVYIFQVSALLPVSNKVSFICENYVTIIDSNSTTLITPGVRIFSKKKQNFLTVSLIIPTGDIGIIGFPFFSGTVALK